MAAYSASGSSDGGVSEGTPKGLLLGRDINLNPQPPEVDRLRNPLVIPKLPTITLVSPTLGDRLVGAMALFGAPWRAAELRLMWEIRETIAAVMATVSPPMARRLKSDGWLRPRKGSRVQQMVRMTHPDQLVRAFDMLVTAPDSLTRDRRVLELLLAVVLRKYMQGISQVTGVKFSFESEAREYCLKSYQAERQLKNVTDRYERFTVLQNTYSGYFFARNYYLYSLLAREKVANEGKMFSMYCRAVFFMSRMEWDGTLVEHVNRRRLPLRSEVMFLVKRDQALQQRYTNDTDFATQIKNVLNFFPSK